MIPDSVRDSLYRIGAIARHNTIIRRRDPGQMIAYLFMPMILMVVLGVRAQAEAPLGAIEQGVVYEFAPGAMSRHD